MLRVVAITSALAFGLGAAGGFTYAKDRFDMREALSEAQADLAAERRAAAHLRAEVETERTRAAAAEFMAAEAAAFGEAQLLRAADLEDTIDEILATPGGDARASDLLLDAIGLRPE